MKFKAPILDPPQSMAPSRAVQSPDREPVAQPQPASRSNPLRATPASAIDSPRGRRSPATLVWFSRQLYLLVSSGMPIVEAIDSLARQATDTGWECVLRHIHRTLVEGIALSQAMAAHPRYFDTVFVSLVAAGESSGDMAGMLERLASLTNQQIQVRRAVVGALIYPALLLSAAGGALGAMVIVVLPRFTTLFESLKIPLPPTTALLIDLSTFVRSYWPLLLVALGLFATACVLLPRHQASRLVIDRTLLGVPRIGRLLRSFATARISRLLGTLLCARVPLLTSMGLVRDSMHNMVYADMIARAEQAIEHGDPVSSAFQNSKLVDPIVYEAVRSGERTGKVGELLLDVADFLDDENKATIKNLTTLIEPVILILLGLVVGFIAVSLFLPLFDITANAQGPAS